MIFNVSFEQSSLFHREIFIGVKCSACTDLTTGGGTNVFENTLTYNGHTYALMINNLTWDAAKTLAEQNGGYLVMVNDAAENQFLINNYLTANSQFWIGFNDIAQEGTWVWANGESASYTNWYTNEPNDVSGEDCATYDVLYPGASYPSLVGWNDLDCLSTHQAIVEWDSTTGGGGTAVEGATIYSTPTTFNANVGGLGTATLIDFEDAAACAGDTIEGCTAFDGNFYSASGATFSNPNSYPLYIAPGGLFWNTSNSLSVGRFPNDPLSPKLYNEDDDLVITFSNPVTAASLDFLDAGSGTYVEFKSSTGALVASVSIPSNYTGNRAFVGVISTITPIKVINIVDGANDGDDIGFDDITFY
jgi:hypothetical protein